MSKGSKIAVGLLTLWPVVYMGLFFVFVFGGMLFSMHMASTGGGTGHDGPPGHPPPPWLLGAFPLVFVAHCFTMLVMIGLDVFYIVNVFKNPRVKQEMKVLWAIVLLMGGFIAMPIYWYLILWREAPDATTAPAPPPS